MEFEVERWRDVRVRTLLERQLILSPIVFPPASCAPRFAASIIPGPPPVVTTKRCRFAECASTIPSAGTPAGARLRNTGPYLPPPRPASYPWLAGRRKLRPRCPHFSQSVGRVVAAVDASRPKKNNRVLDLLPAEARQRLAVFRQQPQNPPVRTAEKRLVLIRQRCGLDFLICHKSVGRC